MVALTELALTVDIFSLKLFFVVLAFLTESLPTVLVALTEFAFTVDISLLNL